jgi:hypothetical protein
VFNARESDVNLVHLAEAARYAELYSRAAREGADTRATDSFVREMVGTHGAAVASFVGLTLDEASLENALFRSRRGALNHHVKCLSTLNSIIGMDLIS